jgi:CheY-like chemotaxis protein
MFRRTIRALLVEDNRELRKTLATILRTAGLKVDTAPDASDALRLCARHRYDVAVVDMVLLPGPGGIEVIRNLRSTSPSTRVLACTAYCKSELLAEASALGVEQVLCKPVDPGLLIQLIQKPAGPVRPRRGPGHDYRDRSNDSAIPLRHPVQRASWLGRDHGTINGVGAVDLAETSTQPVPEQGD